MRLIALCAAALLLAGCADSSPMRGNAFGGNAFGGKALGDNASARPRMIVVTDFVVSSDLVVIDRGYTARLEKKIGEYPTFERKPRTLERVNDEIVATIVATLRSAGLDARPGSEEAISLADRAVVASGRLAPANASAKKNEAGIGGGHSGVVAEMSLSGSSTFGKKKLLDFSAVPAGGKKIAGGKAAAAANAAIAKVLGEKAAVKLSPDVEAAARGLGRAAGDRIVAFAREQGWLNKPDDSVPDAKPVASAEEPKVSAAAPPEQMVRLPSPRPAKKPAA
jgi:hypothetical protein